MSTKKQKDITVAGAHALALWLYNLSPEEQVVAVYGADIASSYKEEKMTLAKAGFQVWWGCLDKEHRQILIDAVMARYGEEGKH
jgi:hypothetical protein